MVVLDEWKLEQPKTKDFISLLGGLKLEGKTLIVDSLENTNLMLASRNVKRTKIVNSYGLNIYDLLYHDKLVLTRAAAEELAELLKPEAKKAEAAEPGPEPAAVEERKPKRAPRKKKEAA